MDQAYVRKLRGLHLTFEQCVFTIAFGLEEEILERGKEAVFSELPSQEWMAARIDKILGEESCYVLREVLGYPYTEEDQAKFHKFWRDETAEDHFAYVVNWLRGETERYESLSTRARLLGEGQLKKHFDVKMAEEHPDMRMSTAVNRQMDGQMNWAGLDTAPLQGQLKQLMDEVRLCNQKLNQTLVAIETLLEEAKNRAEVPEKLSAKSLTDVSPEAVNLQGSIEQIDWPKRSRGVLQELNLKTLAEAVEYFSNFDNFVEGERITLWEWSVIAVVLRRAGLLAIEKEVEVKLDLEVKYLIGAMPDRHSVRLLNCLRRSAYAYVVGDLVSYFADGAYESWYRLAKIRNMGRKTLQSLIDRMRVWAIIIPPELCSPTLNSGIEALDFNQESLKVLRWHGVTTIGELVMTCQSQSRFYALRHLNAKVYKTAVRQLQAYGFNV